MPYENIPFDRGREDNFSALFIGAFVRFLFVFGAVALLGVRHGSGF